MSATVPISLNLQLITVSIITLQRQISHNLLANRNQWNNAYDFVVVGGGTAGCVVAARLSENPKLSVLLVEAGGPATVITDIPGALFSVLADPQFSWGYSSVRQQRVALASADRTLALPTGRGMGGSGVLTAMAYNRGNRRTYDGWANKYGAKGWSYQEVLPYFIRSENNSDPEIVRTNPGYHGTSGPLAVRTEQNPGLILLGVRDAYNQLGIRNTDINGGTQVGTAVVQMNVNPNGVRVTTATNYLEPIIDRRPNLHIICRSLVTKILTRRTADNRVEAYSITFTRDGREYTVNARQEIILSAGGFNSPQLLMLSGIGPADHLRQFGIPVEADLPVGNNFQDHSDLGMAFVANSTSLLDIDDELSVSNLYQFYKQSSSPLTRVPTLLTYFSSPVNEDQDWPDGLNYFRVLPIGNDINALTAGIAPELIPAFREYYTRLFANTTFMVSSDAILVRPQSRGTIRLTSRDPTVAPLIDSNTYANPRDLAAHVGIASRVLELMSSPLMQRLITIFPVPIPGCQPCGPTVPLHSCYSYITCWIQALSISEFHAAGTCRMGSVSDPNAVVDERLRVRGVSRLRVTDASIFPEMPNGNTLAATVMVAEKSSDMIKQDYSLVQ